VVTSTGNATSIANGVITNAMLANGAVANLSGTNTGDQTISDATIATTDITTNNFTTAKHGFVPKGTNVGNYLKDDGTWAAPSGSGDMILASTQTVTGAKTFNAGKLINAANTTALAVENFTTALAAVTTSAVAATGEVDANGIRYYTHATGERGVVDVEQFIALTSANTLTSQTAVQPAFDGGGGPANGQITVASSKSYYLDCFINLSAMSASSGSFGFALGGTATFTSLMWESIGLKAATLTTAAASQVTFNTTASNATLVTASTATVGWAHIKGILRVNAGGTIIPQVSLGVAAAATVNANSYFRLTPVGTNTVVSVGNWN
jgi:hypothetical protein